MEGRYIWIALNKDGTIRHCYMADTRPPIPEGENPMTEYDENENKVDSPILELTDEDIINAVIEGKRGAKDKVSAREEIKDWDAHKLRKEIVIKNKKAYRTDVELTDEELKSSGE